MQVRCSRTAALNAFFDMIHHSNKQKIAVIDSGCSLATEAIAEISHYYNITHVGKSLEYTTLLSSSILSDLMCFIF